MHTRRIIGCSQNDSLPSDFEEYIRSLYEYDYLPCQHCNRLKYICSYKQLYSVIQQEELQPGDLIDIQRIVFETIIELQSEEGCEYFDIEGTIVLFRMLVIMMLQKYVIGIDPYYLVALNYDMEYENDLFNQQEIDKLLDYADKLLIENKNMFIIISDLCLGNLQFGDLLINDKGTVKAFEVKFGEKNLKISEQVYRGKDNPYDREKSKTDWKHFERAKKQRERYAIISQRLNSKFYIDVEKRIGIYQYGMDEFDSYKEIFITAIKESREHLYREVIVDDNISIITINRAAFKTCHNELAPPCIFLMYKDLLHCSIEDNEISMVKKFYSSRINDYELYSYNSVIFDYSAPQPYIWGVTDVSMTDLFDHGVEVFIRIKLEGLFDYLRNQGLKIYPKKRMPSPFLLIHNNKNWMIDYDGHGPLAFTHDTLKRIFCGFYTSKGLADLLKIQCMEVEEAVLRRIEEMGQENEYN